MATADELLELMSSWMEQRSRCARELRKLARELELLREKCNVADSFGSVYSLLGSGLLLGTGVLTLVTGGAAAPLMVATGSALTVTGVTLQLGSKLTEEFLSNSTIKEAQEEDRKSNITVEKIEKLHQELRNQKQEMSESADPDELENDVMMEIVMAIARRQGIKKFSFAKFRGRSMNFQHRQMMELTKALTLSYGGLLALFSLRTGGRKFNIVLSAGAKKLGQKMGSVGLKAVAKGGALAVGGAIGVYFSLNETIESWTELIKKNHVTEASQSLRSTADEMEKTVTMLKEQLEDIQKVLEEMDCKNQEMEEQEQEKNSDDEEKNGSGQDEREDQEWDQEPDEESDEKTDEEQDQESDEEQDEESDEKTDEESDEESGEESDEEDSSVDLPPMTVGVLNCRSVRQKTAALSDLIAQNNLDALLTCETWLNRNNEDSVLQQNLPEGFDYYHRPRNGRRGGGVGVHFRMMLMHEWLTHRNQFDITTFEFLGILLTDPQWTEPILIINMYRPPGGNRVRFQTFLNEFRMLVDALYIDHHHIVIVGDFNIWVDVQNNTRSRMFQRLVQSYRFIQHVNSPTHEAGHTLDLVLTRNINISLLRIERNPFSDHFTVIFTMTPRRLAKMKRVLQKIFKHFQRR